MDEPETLLDGIVMGESPRWHDGRLWMADWGAGEVLSIGPEGDRRVERRVDGLPISIDRDPEGRLLVVAGAARALLREGDDGGLEELADLRPICDRPWNEIVVDARGNAFVNCIGFDLMTGEAPADGFVAVVAPDGTARRVADGLGFPNGMAVLEDGTTLVVAESYANRLTAFTIEDDGSLRDRRTWADLGDGCPDGITVDADGAVWFADVPNRRCTRVAEGGVVLDVVGVDRGCFACALGGDDGRTLFVVAAEWGGPDAVGGATGVVLAVRAPAAHAGRP